VGSRTALDDVDKRKILPLPRLEARLLGRPVRSHSHAISEILFSNVFYLITNNSSDVII
jgi:hypothetical protein